MTGPRPSSLPSPNPTIFDLRTLTPSFRSEDSSRYRPTSTFAGYPFPSVSTLSLELTPRRQTVNNHRVYPKTLRPTPLHPFSTFDLSWRRRSCRPFILLRSDKRQKDGGLQKVTRTDRFRLFLDRPFPPPTKRFKIGVHHLKSSHLNLDSHFRIIGRLDDTWCIIRFVSILVLFQKRKYLEFKILATVLFSYLFKIIKSM